MTTRRREEGRFHDGEIGQATFSTTVTSEASARSTGEAIHSIRLHPHEKAKSEGRLMHLMVDVCGLDSTVRLLAGSPGERKLHRQQQQQPAMEPMLPTQPPASSSVAAPANSGGKRKKRAGQAVRINSSVVVGEEFSLAVPVAAPETAAASDKINPRVPRIPDWQKVVALNEQSVASQGWLPHASPRIANQSGFSDHPSQPSSQHGSVVSGTSSAMTGVTATVSMTSRNPTKSNYKRLLKERAVQTARERDKEYTGQYTVPFKTKYEKEHGSKTDKSKWVGSQRGFVSAFGSNSPLPLRQDGAVRAFSVTQAGNEWAGIKAGDTVALRKDDKDKWIGKHLKGNGL